MRTTRGAILILAASTAALAGASACSGVTLQMSAPGASGARGGAPASAVAVRTERFVLRASAFLELYAQLDGAADEAVVRRLAACDDEPCARRAAEGAPVAAAFDAQLGPFLRHGWAEDAAGPDGARAAIDGALALVAPHEDALAERLARDLGLAWPRDAVVIPVTRRARAASGAEEADAPPSERPTLDAAAGCAEGARAIECVLAFAARALAADSELYRAMGDEGPRLWPMVSAVAAGFVAEGAARGYRASWRDATDARAEARDRIAREWTKRARGEETAEHFGRRIARELAF